MHVWYVVAALISLSVILLFLFGPSFGTGFVVSLIVFVIFIILSRRLYIVTQSRLYKVLSNLLSISLSVFLAIFLLVAFFISSEYQANEGVSEEIDYVIILGAGLRGIELSNTLKGRLDTGLDYLRNHPNTPVILSGGKGPGENMTEAEAMAAYLSSKGIEKERLILESQSTTTEENLAYSKLLMKKDKGQVLSMLIITSDYHVFRAKQLAKEKGYTVYTKASSSPIFVRLNYTIRECFGVTYTFLKSVI